jgi:hypothetical protein
MSPEHREAVVLLIAHVWLMFCVPATPWVLFWIFWREG